MNYLKYIAYLCQALSAYSKGKLEVNLGGYDISLFDKGGAPVHFTLGLAAAAAGAVASGKTGEITSGDTTLKIVPPGATA